MPGNELIGREELTEINKIFKKSDGVLFAHGFEKEEKIFLELETLKMI